MIYLISGGVLVLLIIIAVVALRSRNRASEDEYDPDVIGAIVAWQAIKTGKPVIGEYDGKKLKMQVLNDEKD